MIAIINRQKHYQIQETPSQYFISQLHVVAVALGFTCRPTRKVG